MNAAYYLGQLKIHDSTLASMSDSLKRWNSLFSSNSTFVPPYSGNNTWSPTFTDNGTSSPFWNQTKETTYNQVSFYNTVNSQLFRMSGEWGLPVAWEKLWQKYKVKTNGRDFKYTLQHNDKCNYGTFMASEYIGITNLFLNKIIKMVNSFWKFYHLNNNSTCLGTG